MSLLKNKVLEWFIFVCIILLLSFGAHQRNVIWGNDVALWEDCVKKSPQKERPHHNLGFAYYELERWDEAQSAFEEALRLNPRYSLSMYNLGLVFYRKGDMEEAIDRYKKAIALDSTFPESYYNLGLAYYQEGLHREAIEAYRTFLELKPNYENGHLSLALAYAKVNQTGPGDRGPSGGTPASSRQCPGARPPGRPFHGAEGGVQSPRPLSEGPDLSR